MTMKKMMACVALASIWIMVVLVNVAAANAQVGKADTAAVLNRYAAQTETTSYVSPHSPAYPDIVLEQDDTDR